MKRYFGTYETFKATSKDESTALLSADSIVGDTFRIDIELSDGIHRAWLVNKFDDRVGCFNERFSRELSVLRAQDLVLTAVLSFIAYTDRPEPGVYWGEMAVIGYHPSIEKECLTFIDTVSKRMAEGNRTMIDFDNEGVNRILDSDGTWVPDQIVPLPTKEKGTAIMRYKRSMSEAMIEQGRKGNIGCYVVSWAFIIGLAVGAFLLLKTCVGF